MQSPNEIVANASNITSAAFISPILENQHKLLSKEASTIIFPWLKSMIHDDLDRHPLTYIHVDRERINFVLQVWCAENGIEDPGMYLNAAYNTVSYDSTRGWPREVTVAADMSIYNTNGAHSRISALEMMNIGDTMDWLFYETSDVSSVSVLEIHERLMKGFKGAGKLRTSYVMAGNGKVYPAPPIMKEMFTELIEFTTRKMEEEITLAERLALATLFIVRFLDIHPFLDGNGRTARFMFSHIMGFNIPAPISLCDMSIPFSISVKNYLDGLVEDQKDLTKPPLNTLNYVRSCLMDFMVRRRLMRAGSEIG